MYSNVTPVIFKQIYLTHMLALCQKLKIPIAVGHICLCLSPSQDLKQGPFIVGVYGSGRSDTSQDWCPADLRLVIGSLSAM